MNSKIRCLVLDETHKLVRMKISRAAHKIAKVNLKQPNWSYFHNPGSEPLRAVTIGNLFEETVNKFGDTEALVSISQNRRLTFHQAKTKVDQLAAGLISLGLKPGDRVGLLEPNTEEWYISFLAGAKAGVIVMNLNPANLPKEIAHCLQLTGARALIVRDTFLTQNYYDSLVSIMPELERAPTGSPVQVKDFPEFSYLIMNTDQTLPGTFRLQDIYSLANKESTNKLDELAKAIQPDDACNIQFTSGTTGLPKAAALTHFGSLNNAYFIGKRFTYDRKRPTICCSVPFFHTYGTTAVVLTGLYFGATCVLPSPSYNSSLAIEAIAKEQCTALYGTPTMHLDICALAEQSKEPSWKDNLDVIVTAGSLLLPKVYDRIKNVFPSTKIYSIYGMTETSPSSFQSRSTDTEDQRKYSVGFVQDHVEVKIVDGAGKMVPFGSPGELWCRGYVKMLGYYNQDSKTAEMIGKDCWIKTGDEAILSEDGYAQIVGRIKDLIIRGGENISPKEVEDLLQAHPDIYEAQVFGVADERLGEVVGAALILRPGKSITVDEIKTFCKGKISHFKIPKYVQFLTEFPKTGSGKIKKHILKTAMEKAVQAGDL
ncbi:unnamed protein product [Bemisia tabaci]|uniref:Medium-chain acyl-CoA ligase ACSF2, mitochondrial n=1 Tax=Bemisia tabaci TaxID=7038 RepID=A0A9P0AF88_BEMTA|nr:unnamed protein product [Bemisia tabaci]